MAKDERKGPLRGRAGRMKGGRGSGRTAGGTVRLWGRHAVTAALSNPRRQTRKLWATREALDAFDLALPEGLPIEYAETPDLTRLVARDAPHQGLVLECATLPDIALSECLDQAERRTLVVLDQVTDPHNLGAIMRSAAAFGAAAIVTQDRHAPPESGTVAKAASGALDILPWVRVVNLARALEQMAEAGYWRIALSGGADVALEAALPDRPVALVLGAEGDGIRQNVVTHCDATARLPMSASVESLNVSNAAAVALYAITMHDQRRSLRAN